PSTAPPPLSLPDALPIYVDPGQARQSLGCPGALLRAEIEGLDRPHRAFAVAVLLQCVRDRDRRPRSQCEERNAVRPAAQSANQRSEEHTSELQSRFDLVC